MHLSKTIDTNINGQNNIDNNISPREPLLLWEWDTIFV